MPFYSVREKGTEIVQPLPQMSFAELQKFLSDNPQYEQVIEAPAAVKVKW